ncbi:hypothetical protein [Candidatus Poriferisodalis sp.]|uniref:hypothetical protein n=1 Tax=Candidatus Poriferisodalis sp. TaxID=3101277 RepID=UPI003B02AE4A
MRTTINLPDGLAEEAKQKARESGRTFTSLVIEGLRQVLSESDMPVRFERLPVHGSSSDRPLVDVSDRDALAAALDADGLR